MRLESAVLASREGLAAHGQAIGVIGDNISNANTTGYKTSRTEFADLVSEGADGRSSYQVSGGGSGVQVAQIRTLHETGTIEFTGRSLDVAIGGKGFFMVGDAADPSYERAGNFQINENGLLVDSGGKTVLGIPASQTGAAAGSTLGALDMVNIDLSGKATSTTTFSGNLDPSSAVATPVANPTSFKEIAQAASFTSGSTVYDSLGAAHNITVAFYKTGANAWTSQAYIDGGDVGGTAGQPVQLGANSTLTFSGDGLIETANQAAAAITAAPTYANGATAGAFTIDMSKFTQYANGSQLSGITQDGKGTGDVKGYEFKKDGRVVAILSSGSEIDIGTIKLTDFRNLDGLQRAGNNLFRASAEAGAYDPASPGTAGLGELQGSSLERSTVDLAGQFVELTLYQRGYQANSQVLSAATGMIKDTLALIR